MRKPSFCRYFIGTSEGVPGVRHLYCVTHVSGHATGDVMCLTCHNEAQFECLYSSVLMSPSNNAYIQVREALKNKNIFSLLWGFGVQFKVELCNSFGHLKNQLNSVRNRYLECPNKDLL